MMALYSASARCERHRSFRSRHARVGVEFGRTGRQRKTRDAVRYDEGLGTIAAGLVEHHDDVPLSLPAVAARLSRRICSASAFPYGRTRTRALSGPGSTVAKMQAQVKRVSHMPRALASRPPGMGRAALLVDVCLVR
jgi:hypothetical protein